MSFDLITEGEFEYNNQEGKVRVTKAWATRRYEKGVLYVDVANESLAENLMNRRNRPVQEYKKIAKLALAEAGYDLTKIRLTWSQKAGCSCPCSPGFVISNPDDKYDWAWKTVVVRVSYDEKVLNNGYITPLEAYGFVGEFAATPTFEEAVAVDMAAC